MPNNYARRVDDNTNDDDEFTVCEEFDHLHDKELGMIFPIEYLEEEHLYED